MHIAQIAPLTEAIPPKLHGGTDADHRLQSREVVDDGVTGFIVEDEKGAIGAFDRLSQLSRERIRRQFEQRFTARRMAQEYLAVYRSLAERHEPRLRLVADSAPAL